MNLKRFAVRGLVALAVFVALCMFFSGTIRTITTPKVKLTAGRRGKLEERISLSGKLFFRDVDPIYVELPADMGITITGVNTREGYAIGEGDVVVKAKLTGYEQLRRQYQDSCDQATEQLITLESKYRSLRVTKRDEAYAEAFYAARDARREASRLATDMDAQLYREGLQRAETGYPEGASAELEGMIDRWRAAVSAQQAAQAALDDASRYTVDDTVWTYITEKHDAQQKLEEGEEGLRQLVALNDAVASITAPHEGYIASMTLKEGDVYDGSTPLYEITQEGALPILRADTSESRRNVAEGMTVTMNAGSYDAIDTTVLATGIDVEGKRYADIALTDEMIRQRGSVYAMTQEETPLTLIYRAREATTLLPVSAVRGSGEERYIYYIERADEAFGGEVMKIRKADVTVLAESDGTASIEEDISWYTIAYMEDRPIAEGDTVMEYIS